VRPGLAGVLPEPFGWIEFGRVGWELMHFEPLAVAVEPAPDLPILVVGGVVLNQDGTAAALVRRKLLQKSEVAFGVEHAVPPVVEAGPLQFDRAQDLHALALPGDQDFGRMTDATPRGMQGRVLPKARFVGEDQRAVLAADFFLRFG
jgi:hypothetical protein